MAASNALLALAAGAVLWGTVPASADCMCSANGTRYELGAVVCVKTTNGAWLGRCGKVLNNTSWTKLTDGCPVTRDASGGTVPMSRPAPAEPVALSSAPNQG